MKKTSKTTQNSGDRIVFFGNERLSTAASTDAPTLRALAKAGYKIEAVIVSHEDPVSHQKRDLEIGPVAQSLNIPVILVGKNIPLIDKVKKHPASVAVLVAFGKIIPQEVIDLFPKGIINIHPSLLPKLRGPTPIETTILQGLSQTGVSLMKIDAKMDAGLIYAQQSLNLNGTETKAELTEKLNKLGADLLIRHLDAILNGSLKPKAQVPAEVSYTKMIKKQDGEIDWNQSAKEIERQIRAYAGWPKSRGLIGKKEVIVTEAKSTDLHGIPGEVFTPKEGLFVFCGQGALHIIKLIPTGKKEISGSEFIRGYLR